MPLAHYAIKFTSVFRDFLENKESGFGEDLRQPSSPWSEFQNCVPETQPRSPSDTVRSQPPSPALNTTLDFILNCSPPNPRLHQRHFSEKVLNEDLVDFDQFYEEPFIDDQADESAESEMDSIYSEGSESASDNRDQAQRLNDNIS